VIPDSAAAYIMRKREVDVVIVGTDRTTACGDVANKIGTYPLALAAADNEVPFYVAVPSPSIDWGTATSAIYQGHDAGLQVHVWVDETRPRLYASRPRSPEP